MSVVLWALAGALVVAASLPILGALSGAVGLGPPPVGGVFLLGTTVVLGWASGALVGALIGRGSGRRAGCGALAAAAAAGLVLGGVLCALVLPLYTQSVVDGLARESARLAAAQGRTVLRDRRLPPTSAAVEAAQQLARNGAARLPALSLLGWALVGPALAAGIEARRAARKNW